MNNEQALSLMIAEEEAEELIDISTPDRILPKYRYEDIFVNIDISRSTLSGSDADKRLLLSIEERIKDMIIRGDQDDLRRYAKELMDMGMRVEFTIHRHLDPVYTLGSVMPTFHYER